jgi:uncharacterized protein YuzE
VIKGTYDRQADALAIRLAAPEVAIARTQALPGYDDDDVIVDYAADGAIAAVEILGVSTRPDVGEILRLLGIDPDAVVFTRIGTGRPWRPAFLR